MLAILISASRNQLLQPLPKRPVCCVLSPFPYSVLPRGRKDMDQPFCSLPFLKQESFTWFRNYSMESMQAERLETDGSWTFQASPMLLSLHPYLPLSQNPGIPSRVGEMLSNKVVKYTRSSLCLYHHRLHHLWIFSLVRVDHSDLFTSKFSTCNT